MVAGFRMNITVWRMNQVADDDIGGAIFTGTAVYQNLPALVDYREPNMLLLEQGIEVKRMAKVMIQPGTFDIKSRDELEIVGPVGHEDVGKRMRIRNISRTGFSPNDSRGRWLVLTCERYEYDRDEQ